MKFKLSWRHFLVVILAIIVLSFLIQCFKQNTLIEGMTKMDELMAKAKEKTGGGGGTIADLQEKVNEAKEKTGGGEGTMADLQEKVQEVKCKKEQDALDACNNKKEGFQNLSWAPLPQGKSECLDPLAPYKIHNCGPINIDNFFSSVQFKPECCGNPAGSSYSNSVGCACLCPEQLTFLNSRGGNRTFPTEF